MEKQIEKQVEDWTSNRTDRIQTNMVGRTVWIKTGSNDEGGDIYHPSEVVDVYLRRHHEGHDELLYTITYSQGYRDGRTALLTYQPHNVYLTDPN